MMLPGAGETRKAHWQPLGISRGKEKKNNKIIQTTCITKKKKSKDEVMQLRTNFNRAAGTRAEKSLGQRQ